MTILVNDREVQCNYTVEVPMVELVDVLVKEELKQRQQVPVTVDESRGSECDFFPPVCSHAVRSQITR